MPDMSEDRGLIGEPAKEVWLGDAMKREHERMQAEMLMPKVRKVMASIPFEPPWVSISQAPTEEDIRKAGYGGSA